jgi:DNA-binding XRE family transcriptional regulator
MAHKTKNGLITAETPTATTPFNLDAFVAEEDRREPGFAAAVEAELASLKLNERMRELRRARHMTQEKLAERMGLTQSAVAQLEKPGSRRMEIATVARFATALGFRMRVEFEPQQPLATAARTRRRKVAARA